MDLPIYEVISTNGPPHDRTFDVIIRINSEIKGRGKEKQKKGAEQLAAKQALVNLPPPSPRSAGLVTFFSKNRTPPPPTFTPPPPSPPSLRRSCSSPLSPKINE